MIAKVQLAQLTTVAMEMPRIAGLHLIDWFLLGVYILGMLGLGWYYSRKQEDTKEYFVGSGAMNSTLIGISLFATLFSTLSYLSYPGEFIDKGPVTLVGIISIPIAFVVVGYVLVPVYMKQRVTSAYELLEARLGVEARVIGALMFLTLRLMWMSVMIYLTTAALLTVMGLDASYKPIIAITFGFIAITYTSMGGLRAVVITDLFQFCLLFLGAILTIVFITIDMGGFGWWPTQWSPTWDHQPLVPTSPHVRVSVVGAIISQTIWRISTSGGDQTAVQRFMATEDAAAARKSYLVHSIAGVVVLGVLAIVGFALLGYYHADPSRLPADLQLEADADKIFPTFIAQRLPMGVSGLVLAALFAAAMSSIDSGVNSITAVVSTDFLDRFGMTFKNEKNHVLFTKVLAFAIGAVVVLCASLIDFNDWNFFDVIKRTVNLLVTPLFALFVMALFIPFATGLGAFIGAIYGIAAAVLIAYWGQLTGGEDVSFQWIGIVAICVDLVAGCIVSKLAPNDASVMRKDLVAYGAIGALVLLIQFIIALGSAAA